MATGYRTTIYGTGARLTLKTGFGVKMQGNGITMKKGSLLIGYARVSKADDQDTAAQVKALRQAGCKRIFEEKASGGRWDRPQLHKALEQLREGDVLVVWKLDRLSRSLKDLLHIMEQVQDAGAGFRSVTEAVDTTTSAGRMVMQMLGSFAEFERSMVRERTRAGLAAARDRGGGPGHSHRRRRAGPLGESHARGARALTPML